MRAKKVSVIWGNIGSSHGVGSACSVSSIVNVIRKGGVVEVTCSLLRLRDYKGTATTALLDCLDYHNLNGWILYFMTTTALSNIEELFHRRYPGPLAFTSFVFFVLQCSLTLWCINCIGDKSIRNWYHMASSSLPFDQSLISKNGLYLLQKEASSMRCKSWASLCYMSKDMRTHNYESSRILF